MGFVLIAAVGVLVVLIAVPVPIPHRVRSRKQLLDALEILHHRGFNGGSALLSIGLPLTTNRSTVLIRKHVVEDNDVRLVVERVTGPAENRLVASLQEGKVSAMADSPLHLSTSSGPNDPVALCQTLADVAWKEPAALQPITYVLFRGVSERNWRIGWTE